MRNKHNLFLEIAIAFAKQSTCCRKQVGAILVKDGRIISTGYNGVLSGYQHCNELPFAKHDWTKNDIDSKISQLHHQFAVQNEVHAEQNVIAFAAKNGVSTDGCTMYTTLAPCNDCSKLLAAAGIKEVFYLEDYDRCSSGIEFLQKHGVSVVKLGA